MTTKTQAQLERRAEILVTNGKQPAAQAAIAGVGYGPAALDAGAALLAAVRQGRARKQELLAGQKKATGAEVQARRAADRELKSLGQTARTLFAGDPATLTALGLQTQYEAAPAPAEGRRAARLSRSAAETLARWRQLLDNAQALGADAASQLSAAGWPASRLTTAQGLVAAYAAADTAQQAAIQAYQAASAQFDADVKALEDWYTRAARLIKVAIKDVDPAGQAQLRELLGLAL